MLFNSLEFLLLFLPATLLATSWLRRRPFLIAVTLASALFYSFSGAAWYLAPMFFSAGIDFWAGKRIAESQEPESRKKVLTLAIGLNLGLLAVFKYTKLIASSFGTVGTWFGAPAEFAAIMAASGLALPPGISFYTFHTMSYSIDVYRREIPAERSLWKYFAFVTFFPHLIAGPIVRFRQLGPELDAASRQLRPRYNQAVILFCIGLCKKILIADRIANEIDPLIFKISSQTAPLAWLALLGYALQIYYDFSGYSDMALGLAQLFGVRLPQNFNSPYKATSPSDFWERWHITLSQWIRDYLYLPLGGSRGKPTRVAVNLSLTMLLAGLWHGAAWTFACWGLYHGALLVLYHRCRRGWDAMPKAAKMTLTFVLVCLGWIFFRADSFEQAGRWFAALCGKGGFGLNIREHWKLIGVVAAGMSIALLTKNPYERDLDQFSFPSRLSLGLATSAALLMMNYSSRFIYYQF